jgi:hypothetical protein
MPEAAPSSDAGFRVVRQDYQVHELTHYLAARPSRDGRSWRWITEQEEALPLTQEEARQLAGQYNALPNVARRGSVARVERSVGIGTPECGPR